MLALADVAVVGVRLAFAGICWRGLLPIVRGAARATTSSSGTSGSGRTELPAPAASAPTASRSGRPPWPVAVLFSLALEEPMALFVLVVADAALGEDQRAGLRPLWAAACGATAVLHAVLIPLALCALGTGVYAPHRRKSTVTWLATLVPFALWGALFLAVPAPASGPAHVTAPALLRLCTAGAVLLGLLSGSAAAAAAADAWADAELWAPGWLRRCLGLGPSASGPGGNTAWADIDYIPLTTATSSSSAAAPSDLHAQRAGHAHASALAAADAAVARARDDAHAKQLALAALESPEGSSQSSSKKSMSKNGGWSGWVLPSALRPSPGGKDAAVLRSELQALERVTVSLERDRALLADAWGRSQRASTWEGRLSLFLDAVVGVYGAMIILQTVASLLATLCAPHARRTPAGSGGEGNRLEQSSVYVTYLLRLLHFPTEQVDPALLSHILTLVCAGLMIANRFRTVMSGLLRLGRYVSSSSQASSGAADALALFLSQAGAAYLLAALLQLRAVLLPHQNASLSTSGTTTGSFSSPSSLPPFASASSSLLAASPSLSTSLSSSLSSSLTSPSSPFDSHAGSPYASSTAPGIGHPPPIPGPAAGVDPGPPLLASLPPFEDAFGTLFDVAFIFAALAAGAVSWFRRREQARVL